MWCIQYISEEYACIIYYDSFVTGPINSVFKNISILSYSSSVDCSFLNNQSFYCMVCCSTDPSVPSDSSVYNISTTRGTEVTVFLQGLISGQVYFCKAAATNKNSAHCAGQVVGSVKMYFNFVAYLPSITNPTTRRCWSSYQYQDINMIVEFHLASHFPLRLIIIMSVKEYFTDIYVVLMQSIQ